jgi:cysteine desulfurase family protein (TIGR01976 family)
MIIPDIHFVRSQFPALSSNWIFMDNAGGTQTAGQVANRIQDYLFNTNVQLGASYDISQKASARVSEAQQVWAKVIHARDPSEIILGSSTTVLLQNLSRSLVQLFEPGDEVIVTNFDHEANIGPWVNMEKSGIHVKVWEINQETLLPDMEKLRHMMNNRTRLVAFSHVSNILGTIHPVKDIASFIHEHGALVCVDGVACAPHRLPDVAEMDVDFYVFSLYKVFGPHYSLMFGKRKHLEIMPGIGHFFIGDDEIPYKLQPGNVNFELTFGSLGIIDYFKSFYNHHFNGQEIDLRSQVAEVYNLIADHEQSLATRLLDYLKSKKNIRIIGETTSHKNIRVPTVSFIVEGRKSSEIPPLIDPHKIGIRFGDFYAKRLIEYLDLNENDGVVRVSMVHYNTIEEVDRLIRVLEEIL